MEAQAPVEGGGVSYRNLVGLDALLGVALPQLKQLDPVREVERAVEVAENEERRALDVIPAPRRLLKSEIVGIDDEPWTDFVFAMRTAQPGAISASNALGMFEMKPRRLCDLGVMRDPRCTRSPSGRLVWVGDFVEPMTQREFLKSPSAQYQAFSDSMRSYVVGLAGDALPRPEKKLAETSLSGALAILHRSGPSGLKSWETNQFPDTLALYERANGIF